MKYKIEKLFLVSFIQEALSLGNYTHFKIVKGGVIISSNKNFKIDKVFIPSQHISFITFN